MTTTVGFEEIEVRPGEVRLGGEILALRPIVDASSVTRHAEAVVTVRGDDYRVRAWTFGERRRLLAAHLAPDGALDVEGITGAALAGLVRPVPEDSVVRELMGLTALVWSATTGAATPAPLPGVDAATQAVRLAAVTGWRPADLDDAPAADVDRWYAALPSTGPTDAGPDTGPDAGPDAGPDVGPGAGPAAGEEPVGDGFRTFRLEG